MVDAARDLAAYPARKESGEGACDVAGIGRSGELVRDDAELLSVPGPRDDAVDEAAALAARATGGVEPGHAHDGAAGRQRPGAELAGELRARGGAERVRPTRLGVG